MNIYATMLNLMPIVYPQFYTLHDTAKNELVFLKTGETEAGELNVTGKTQCEAVNNHFHLFEKVGEKNYESVVEIGKNIANNLFISLTQSFPNKSFVVYLEVNVKDSVIIRFHQKWEDEPPYFDMTQGYKDVKIFELRN